MQFDYFYGNEAEQFTFYRIPKVLVSSPQFKKLHRPDCHTLPAEKNRVEFTSRADAINAGYSPCGNCQP